MDGYNEKNKIKFYFLFKFKKKRNNSKHFIERKRINLITQYLFKE